MSINLELNIPGYKIKRQLGRGGMAVVFLAIQESFGREVALKVLTPDRIAADESFTERFIREARIVSSLVHPNIVTVFDVGVHQGYHYLSMEYIDGMDLKDAQATITRREMLRIVKDVAHALEYAGNKGYVHRDVKPENIMIHKGDGRVILMDFGIAHGLDNTLDRTSAGRAVGTPYYMSPEQSKGKSVDFRSDIYSLGVVLYQLLTGYVPYDAESVIAVGIKHITEPVPKLPARLKMFQSIIDTAMAKDPDDRFQSARAFIDALNNINEKALEAFEKEAVAFKMAGKDYNAVTLTGDEVPSGDMPVAGIPHVPPRVSAKTGGESTITTGVRRRRVMLFVLLLALVVAAGYFKRQQVLFYWHGMTAQVASWVAAPQSPASTPSPETQPPAPEAIASPGEQHEAASSDPADGSDVGAADTPDSGVIASAGVAGENIVSPQPTATDGATAGAENDAMTLQERIQYLSARLDENPEHAIQLAALYKSILQNQPQQPSARNGIRQLRQWYQQQIDTALGAGELPRAKQLMGMLVASFPRVQSSEPYRQLQSRVESLQAVQTHVQKARSYAKAGHWLEPQDGNALQQWRAVLALEPGHQEALDGVRQVAGKIYAKAKQQRARGRYYSARALVKKGRQAFPDDRQLAALEKKLSRNLKQRKHIKTMLSVAETRLLAGHLISPGGENAYQQYQAILKLDKNNTAAAEGLKRIEQQLVQQVREALRDGELERATMGLASIKQYFTASRNVAVLQQQLATAVKENQPKVTQLQFSATELTSLSAQPADKLKLGRTLYVGFQYKNFEAETTLLQAILLDGGGKIQIAQKPVIVSGDSGNHYFNIELPVEGFAEGSYKLELVMGDKKLITGSILVDK